MTAKWADHYTLKAKAEGYKARSVYKLKEIQKRFKIVKPGDKVLDLGCFPGSWSQFLLEQVGEEGRVLGVDLKVPEGIVDERFRFLKADVFQLREESILDLIGSPNVILSDLAPATTGIHSVDCARSMELVSCAFALAKAVLKEHGNFVFKAFHCQELGEFQPKLKAYFKNVRNLRPRATRSKSREVFCICMGFRKK